MHIATSKHLHRSRPQQRMTRGSKRSTPVADGARPFTSTVSTAPGAKRISSSLTTIPDVVSIVPIRAALTGRDSCGSLETDRA